MDAKLFLGYPLKDEALFQALKEMNPNIYTYFIDNGSDYLQTLEWKEDHYLGKQVPPLTDLETLENLQENIYSLLHKLLPNYPFRETALKLFTKVDHLE